MKTFHIFIRNLSLVFVVFIVFRNVDILPHWRQMSVVCDESSDTLAQLSGAYDWNTLDSHSFIDVHRQQWCIEMA